MLFLSTNLQKFVQTHFRLPDEVASFMKASYIESVMIIFVHEVSTFLESGKGTKEELSELTAITKDKGNPITKIRKMINLIADLSKKYPELQQNINSHIRDFNKKQLKDMRELMDEDTYRLFLKEYIKEMDDIEGTYQKLLKQFKEI